MLGRILDDRYAIVRLLGQGGMGAVYEARHNGTGRRVAVKVILGESAHEEILARFQREARAVGAVESDHIAQVFDTGRDRETGSPYIAMEFLEGEDVQALIDRLGALPVDLALRIGVQACLGLERAHQAGVVHRDIKPANLFLTRKAGGARVVKLLDFGVAKVAVGGLENGALTKTGAMLGSPFYMSPEQARGSGAVDARTDLWSLGITLYHALSGHRPNEHMTGLGELVVAICTTPVRWLQEIAPWVPAEVAQLVHRALVIDPAQRISSAGELAAALRALLPMGETIDESMLVPLGATTRASVAPRVTAPPPAPPLGFSGTAPATSVGVTRSERPAHKPAVALWVGGGVAAAVVGLAAAFWAARGGSSPAPAAPATVEPAPLPTLAATATAPPAEPSPRPAMPEPAPSPAALPPAETAAPVVSAKPKQPAASQSPSPARQPAPKASDKTPPPPPKPPRNTDDETSRK